MHYKALKLKKMKKISVLGIHYFMQTLPVTSSVLSVATAASY